MSNRELAIELINQMPEYKIGYAIAYLQGLSADEVADDLYCVGLLREYQSSTDRRRNCFWGSERDGNGNR